MLLDWTKTQSLTLDEIAEAAAHLPPLTQAQLDEMTITQIGEYAAKAFRLSELAHKTFAQWMEAHWLMLIYIHDKTTAQGRRLPTPNYPSWGEVIRRAFPMDDADCEGLEGFEKPPGPGKEDGGGETVVRVGPSNTGF
jgi:hypothetical protein